MPNFKAGEGADYLQMVNRARLRMVSLDVEFNEAANRDLYFPKLEQLNQQMVEYKIATEKFDFVDMIEKFIEHHNNLSVKPAATSKPKTNKPKLTAFDKAMGLDKPLHKEGVAAGAKKQFEARCGKPASSDAQFLIDLERKMKMNNAKLGRGKRSKKPTAKGKACTDTLGRGKVVPRGGRRK